MTIVLPGGAGSSTDADVRQMAAKLQPRFGQPVLVENRVGGNSSIAPAYVAKARPDGYTILYASTSSFATAPGTVKSLPYDPVRDFSGITLTGEAYFALLTRAEFKSLSFSQFLERMRKEPELFPVGGQAVSNQIYNKLMTDAARLSHTYVPYAGPARMMSDLWGGRLGSALMVLNLALPTLGSGQGHIVALSSTQRMPSLPHIPTMDETLPGVHITSLSGYYAPARTPRPIINSLYAHMSEVVKDPEVMRRIEVGGRTLFLAPEETDVYLKKEVSRWTALLKAAGIEPE